MDLIKQPKTRTIVRVDISQQLDKYTTDAPSVCIEMNDALDGDGKKYSLQKMANRYATKLEKGKSRANGTETEVYLVKSAPAAKLAIKHDIMESVDMGVYPRIVSESATLFTEGASYNYEPKNLDFTDSLAMERERGDDLLAMSRVDELSFIGSSVCLIQILGDKYNYQPIPRQKVWVAYNPTIEENGEQRPTNLLNLDEASAAVVQLANPTIGTDKRVFAAWIPGNDIYPNGRFVRWSGDTWAKIPYPDESNPEIWDYRDESGELANPLTKWRKMDPQSPEIPLVIWYGSTAGYGKELLPVDSWAWEQSQEINVGCSRLATTVLKSARGIFPFTKEKTASNVIPQVIDEGPVILEQGTTLDAKGIPADNSLKGMELYEKIASSTAEKEGVPSYMVRISGSADFPSGEALKQANDPLIRKRRRRAEINRGGMKRKYHLERSLAGISHGKVLGKGVEETWVPNDREFPETAGQILDKHGKELALEITDTAEVVQSYRNLKSRKDAEKHLKTLDIDKVEEEEDDVVGSIFGQQTQG